jgi:hypothetical protein
MNSVQESKQELEAAIRYAENAISSANKTIESMEFRQDMAKKQSSEQTGREQALLKKLQVMTDKYDQMKGYADSLLDENGTLEERADSLVATAQRLKQEQPTMPVIPKAVAIAIFREGMSYGATNVCDELDNSDIEISDRECMGAFEVEFQQYVDLSDHLDLDYLQNSVSECDDSTVIDALKFLCADNKFECRIHGVDDQGDDSKNA